MFDERTAFAAQTDKQDAFGAITAVIPWERFCKTVAEAKGRLCRCVRRPQHLAHWVRLLRRGINLEITWFRQSFS